MTRVPGAAVAVIGGVAALVLAGGVTSAVTRAHTDRMAALPAVCRDNPGSAGGALPSGRALQQALGQAGTGSAGAASAQLLAAKGQLGSGTTTELQLRVQALGGGTSDTGSAPTTGGGQAQAQDPQTQGDTGGNGGGSGGPGGAGSGGQSGNQTGTRGGSGTAPLAGTGPDRIGNPQQPQPVVSPPVKVTPPPPATVRHPGKSAAGIVLLVIVLLLLAGLVLLVVRRSRNQDTRLPDGTGLAPADADALAARAIDSGDLDLALRWTFVSGLLRLGEIGVLPYDASRTTLECYRWVQSARLPVLAASFDLVAYGGRHSTMADVMAAREGWRQLLAEVSGLPGVPGLTGVRGLSGGAVVAGR